MEISHLDKLRTLVGDPQVDESGLNVGAIHALQTLAAVSEVSRETATMGLRHASPGVRRNALAVLPQDETGLAILMQNRPVFHDANPQVRLQAFLTLADMPASTEAGKVIRSAIEMTRDRVMIEALTSAAATHAVAFFEALAGVDSPTNAALPEMVQRIAEHVGRGRPGSATLARIVRGLDRCDGDTATAILDGFIAGLPRQKWLEAAEVDDALADVFESVEAGTQIKLLRLATRLESRSLESKSKMIVERIVATLTDEMTDETSRVSAARDLIGFRGTDAAAVTTVLSCITPQVSPDFAQALLTTLRQSKSKDVGDEVLQVIETFSPTVKASAIGVLLSKPDWAASLMEAIAARSFDLDELSLEQKQSLRSLPDETLRARAEEVLAMSGGLPSDDREEVLQRLMHVTRTSGDASLGKAVFKRVCANCHQYGDLGQKIGPNLSGMAVHPKEELLTHILDPSRSVEGNYRMYNLLTVDGVVINGMLAGESRTSVTIVDAQAKSRDILREDIERFVVSKKSVMPEGFEQQLSASELTDLLEFLTDTGPYVPYPLDQFATAISTKGLFSNDDSGP
ncbi:MAG: c-type cytochrome, partial [Planctomycetota bacterium]